MQMSDNAPSRLSDYPVHLVLPTGFRVHFHFNGKAMTVSIERVAGNADPAELAALLRRDGAAIVHDALTPGQLAGLNAELDDTIKATSPGLRHPSAQRMIEFYGHSTIRLDGMPSRSAAFREVMLSPLLCGVADALLLPNCKDYLLNTGQLIQIGPGETVQQLHRDEDLSLIHI